MGRDTLPHKEGEASRLLGGTVDEVPAYFYEESGCCCSKAGLMWWMNAVAALFHFAFAILVLGSASQNGDINTPLLTVYSTNLTWEAGTADALKPEFEASSTLSLSWLTFGFFFLSFLMHVTIAIFNFRGGWASTNVERREVKRVYGLFPTNWYFKWIHECRQPARWLEYSISASLMLLTIAISSGVAHAYMLVFIFVLSFTTMMHGHFAEELYGRPAVGESAYAKPTKWATAGIAWRLYPNILGWVPFGAVWAVLLHSFNANTGDGGGPPVFVYIIVYGQFFAFLTFCVTQIVLLVLPRGPQYYYWGELSYLVLSFASKGFLGITLLASVLAFDSFEQALAEAS